jgi:hypothetical protein
MRMRVRLAVIGAVLALCAVGTIVPTHAAGPPAATPDVACHKGDRPETTQGRAPAADYDSGRAALGYYCNAREVGHIGDSGGYRTYRYTDTQGHTCAFYDTTLLFPANAATAAPGQTGVWAMDMTDPHHPIHTDTLRTPAMQSPHESLSLNVKRGLLGAVAANPAFYPGQFDIYDVSQDCRHPVLDASFPSGVLGHEGSFAPDGNTYYSASLFGHTIAAIDVSNPQIPTTIWVSTAWTIHGLNVSDDGNKLYAADDGSGTKGLTVLDTSQVQSRVTNPAVPVISHLTWPEVSTPQTNLPVTIQGHPYLVEIDEFGAGGGSGPVGAARVIDIADPTHPKQVSNLRLAVNNTPSDAGQLGDPGANSSLQGYAGHYCGVPSKVDPGIVACSFIVSGLRVFDIHDPLHPKEIAYFNRPQTQGSTPGGAPRGAYAMSQPAFDKANSEIWYADGNSGFYVVHINSKYWP